VRSWTGQVRDKSHRLSIGRIIHFFGKLDRLNIVGMFLIEHSVWSNEKLRPYNRAVLCWLYVQPSTRTVHLEKKARVFHLGRDCWKYNIYRTRMFHTESDSDD